MTQVIAFSTIRLEQTETENQKYWNENKKKQRVYKPFCAVAMWWFNSGVDGVFGGGGSFSVKPGWGWGAQRGPVAVLAHRAQQHFC